MKIAVTDAVKRGLVYKDHRIIVSNVGDARARGVSARQLLGHVETFD